MPPKFQSSFIPKGPASTSMSMSSTRGVGGRSLLSTIAKFIFVISILLGGAIFGYRFFLEYRIDEMGADLEQARAALDPETIKELTSLNTRIISTKALLSSHQVLSPILSFIEISTPVSVRFTSFQYSKTNAGLTLDLTGEARGYAALALQADIFNKSRYFDSSSFSNLTLNQRGEVEFSFNAIVSPELVSYATNSVVEESPLTGTSTPLQ